ncbi:hypothetical protein Goari_001273 [Gossypium aridum]|uniref:Uncharacterized protein n=1 Tax=Gossypium aridum TaxID=34290 RepID=A0A7J8YJC6_GOSAI|nr:hypothetical protein [Gossypium aridum]
MTPSHFPWPDIEKGYVMDGVSSSQGLPENTSIRHLRHVVHTTVSPPQEIQVANYFPTSNSQSSRSLIPSATELEEAGIHFIERTFRNFMAYERKPRYFFDYVVFMDKLIKTGKDVELLRKSGIFFDNWLRDGEEVTKIFNKLGYFVYYDMCSNEQALQDKMEHMEGKIEDYFNTPWSPISFLAALVLLLLTILQTIFSLLAYYHQRQ